MSSATNLNILQLIRNRELNDHIRTKYTLKSNMDYKSISKLGLLAQLEGRQESVTCIQWNKSGSTLASVSNDRQIILWDPFLQKVKTTIETLHRDSIFSVKFIPGYNDDILATASADQSSHTYNVTTGTKLMTCVCFHREIRSLAVANDLPSVYWCASGDGCISQHDIRMKHICYGTLQNTLVKIFGNNGRRIGPICLDINQIRSEQFAVGANDQYVRLYDRRMIHSLSSFYMKQPSEDALVFDGNNINNALQYFLPGHIQPKNSETITHGITHLTFSPDGQELLVNYGCEYVYLYDLVNRVDNAFFNVPKVMKVLRENKEVSSTNLIDYQVPVPHLTLPDNVVQLKLKANDLFDKEDYTAAIFLYNEAINIHKCSELFLNRAAAYIKRKWFGDFYAALKDCVTALKLEPNHMEAHFQLAVTLFKLNKLTDSKMYLDQFIMKYPSYKTSAAYNCLNSALLNAQSNNKDTFDGKQIHELLHTRSKVPVWFLNDQAKKKAFDKYFRNQAKDYRCRYIGRSNNYCIYNKEANFFGSRNQFIVAGSDDGLIYIWEKNTEKNLLTLQGDTFVVNCIQPHPSEFLFATSSIGSRVKLWSPLPDVDY